VYQEPPQDHRNGFRNFVSIVVFLARALAVSVEVFLHRPASFGERYVGLQGGAALLLIFFWPAFCEPIYDLEPMFIFLLVYVGMCLVVRARIHGRARSGEPEPHSRYNGTPRLMRFTGRMDEIKVKCMVEPAFTFLVGGLFGELSPPLGGYLMVAAGGLLLSNGLAESYERRRARDMQDAYLDQRRFVDRCRDPRGD